MYRAALAQAQGDSERTAAHARAALALAGPDDHFVRGGGAGFLGLAAWAEGDIDEAPPAFEQSVSCLRAAGNHVDALDATVVLADMWVTAGRPSKARALCEQGLRTAISHGEPYPRATADLHTWLAELALGRNDLTEAANQLTTAATLGERASITENQHRWPTVMACVCAAKGEYAHALDLLDEASDRYRLGFYPDLRPLAAMKTRVHLASGDLDAASRWAARSDASLNGAPAFAREYENLTLVRTYLALHRRAKERPPESDANTAGTDLMPVLQLLDRLEASAARTGRHGSLLEIRMLRALTQQARDDSTAAVSTLARALREAPEVEPYLNLFHGEGRALAALLEAAQHAPDVPGADLLTGLAQRLFGPGDGSSRPALITDGTGRTAVAELPDPLSEREREVLRLLAGDLTGPEIARALFISLNTLRTHTKRIFTKLDVTNRSAAVRRGHQLGLE
jgi:LuxR family maltose regulon positive regulatory protein